MALHGISVPALVAAGAGGLVIWTGLKGASLQGGVRSLLSGQQPAGDQVNPVTGGVLPGVQAFAGSGPGGTVSADTGSAIANDALRYQGHGYTWGGAPARGQWDCSSFCNWVVGHDERLAIPGYRAGSYTGALHGPPTMMWAVWPGAKTIPRSQAQAGDLCIWPLHHMGIAISNSQMISALNPGLGTAVTAINGTAGGPLVIRRLK